MTHNIEDNSCVVNTSSLWDSIVMRAQEIEAEDYVREHAPGYIQMGLKNAKNKPWARAMADGLFYRDLRTPFSIVDNATITLASTALDLWLVSQFTTLPANYWTPGKTIAMTAYGKITTAATPGNGTFSVSVSPTVNTTLVSSAAKALVANQTSASFRMEGYITCRTMGTSGTFQLHGKADVQVALILSTAAPILIPDATPTTTTQDTTVATAARMELARSGSTAETATVTALYVEALN